MGFPMDIIEELLMRLPLKSITRFKCVSKDWNDIISGIEFRRRYQLRYHNDKRHCGFFYRHRNPIFFTPHDLRMPPVQDRVKFINTSHTGIQELGLCHDMQQGYVIGSSKGLVLLWRNPMSYHVYDPLTKKHVEILKTIEKKEFVCIGFICKERKQNCSNNIDGNSSYLTYKVVHVDILTPLVGKTKYKVETYSSETGKWYKSVMTSVVEFCLLPFAPPKVIGGVLHWRNCGLKGVTAYDPEDSIGRTTFIENPISGGFKSLTGTLDGRLLCIDEFVSHIDVWFLGSKYEGQSYLDEDFIDHNQWTLSHRIDFEKLGLSWVDLGPYQKSYFGYAIDIHPQYSNIIFIESGTEVLSYNLNEKIIETRSPKSEGLTRPHADTYYYVELPSWPCL